MDTFRALAPPEGLKFTPLFADRVGDTDARVQRLEDAVQTMRNDFDTVVPSLVRLVAVEKDMKALVSQLQTLTDAQPSPLPQVSASPPPPLPPSAYAQDQRSGPLVSGKETVPAITAAQAPQTGQQAISSSAKPSSIAPSVTGGATASATADQKILPATAGQKIPGEDVAGGTETVTREVAGSKASSSLVTPEAAPKGELPPEGAASPVSKPSSPAPALPPVASEKPVTWSPPSMLGGVSGQQGVPLALTTPTAQPQLSSQPQPQPETKTAAPVAAKGESKGMVRSVRVADHKDKTRIVLDLSSKPDYTVSIGGRKGKTLIIEIPNMDWAAIKPFDAESAALVAGWHVEGDKLLLDLLYKSTIKAKQLLAPKGSPSYRIVIDLFSTEMPR